MPGFTRQTRSNSLRSDRESDSGRTHPGDHHYDGMQIDQTDIQKILDRSQKGRVRVETKSDEVPPGKRFAFQAVLMVTMIFVNDYSGSKTLFDLMRILNY